MAYTLKDFSEISPLFEKRKYTEEELKQRQGEALPELLKAVEKVIAKSDKTKEKWERWEDRKDAIRQLRMIYHLYSATHAPSPMESLMERSLFGGDVSREPREFLGLRHLLKAEQGEAEG